MMPVIEHKVYMVWTLICTLGGYCVYCDMSLELSKWVIRPDPVESTMGWSLNESTQPSPLY